MLSRSEKIKVNREFRAKDDSHLWPVCGRFSVAERAIRKARELMRYCGEFDSVFEYQECLEMFAGQIVNDPSNF